MRGFQSVRMRIILFQGCIMDILCFQSVDLAGRLWVDLPYLECEPTFKINLSVSILYTHIHICTHMDTHRSSTASVSLEILA